MSAKLSFVDCIFMNFVFVLRPILEVFTFICGKNKISKNKALNKKQMRKRQIVIQIKQSNLSKSILYDFQCVNSFFHC